MFVDSHCHLDCLKLDDFDHDFDQLIQSCSQSGIEHMLCVSIDMESYPHMYRLVRDYPQISVSVGVHPMADKNQTITTTHLEQLATQPKVVAIGETGLDYYYHQGDRIWQQERFRSHLRCAVKMMKPVIIHTRDASADTLAILREEQAEKCKGVIHCFTESLEFAREALDMNFMISFSGITTFRNADKLREVARFVPDDRILIETDSPYLAPVPHRGKQNWPGLVRHVAETLAEQRKTSVEHIAEITRMNFYRLFSISQH
jgi:TatD DNase family protein